MRRKYESVLAYFGEEASLASQEFFETLVTFVDNFVRNVISRHVTSRLLLATVCVRFSVMLYGMLKGGNVRIGSSCTGRCCSVCEQSILLLPLHLPLLHLCLCRMHTLSACSTYHASPHLPRHDTIGAGKDSSGASAPEGGTTQQERSRASRAHRESCHAAGEESMRGGDEGGGEDRRERLDPRSTAMCSLTLALMRYCFNLYSCWCSSRMVCCGVVEY